jgi:hypothetical protein
MESAAGRRVIVEVRFGPSASRKAVIEPGGALRVGRADKAGMVIPHDEQMSAVHFELTWDGATCLLADLGSAAGTFLGGERVTRSSVGHGDWIRAGSTDFSVFFEMASLPWPNIRSTAPLPLREKALEELMGPLQGGSLHVLLDAARAERILFLLREAVEEYQSLFEGVTAVAMAEGAPYLVKLSAGSALLSRLVLEGWGDAWGVFFTCPRPLKEIRAHFRKIVMVTLEEREGPVYFRFYDPRVLRLFLPTCTARQEDELFGPVDRFLCEGEGGEVVRYARTKSAPGRG